MPLVNLQGVYILPGIPRLFKSMVDTHKDRFRGPANKSRTLYTNTVEGDLAGDLVSATSSGNESLKHFANANDVTHPVHGVRPCWYQTGENDRSVHGHSGVLEACS